MSTGNLSRRRLLEVAATCSIAGTSFASAVRCLSADDPNAPIAIGSQRQLVCDEFIIESNDGGRRKLHQPTKANDGDPILRLDRPWEEAGSNILGTVLRDGGRFRMWYRGGGSGPRGGIWCYAESDDGLAWNKPALGLVEHEGQRDNNIYVLGQPQAFTPFVDPNESDPARRYKSAVNTARIDTALAYSPDGLRWMEFREGAAITGRASDTISQVLWDPFIKAYRLYTRTDYGTAATGEVRGTRELIAAADSDLSDPKSWKKIREWCLGWEDHPPVVSDNRPRRRERDPDFHRTRQLYAVNGWIHEGVQFAVIWALENAANRDGLRETMNAYLATARGEAPWNLEWIYGGAPLLPHGRPGRFDCRWIQPAPTIVTWKNQHWLYYSGQARTHAGHWSPELRGPKGGIGLATIRRDGFVSLHASKRSAVITTRVLRFQGDRLRINATADPTGSVRVEVQDAMGRTIPGFGLNACRLHPVDEIDQEVAWTSGPELGQLSRTPIRLRFILSDADLYAFQFAEQTRP